MVWKKEYMLAGKSCLNSKLAITGFISANLNIDLSPFKEVWFVLLLLKLPVCDRISGIKGTLRVSKQRSLN